MQPYTNDGFEAWRRLKLRYMLTGGGREVDLAVRLYSGKACRNMTELPVAIDLLDREIKHNETVNGYRIPDFMMIAMLVQMFREADAKEFKNPYIYNQESFLEAFSRTSRTWP